MTEPGDPEEWWVLSHNQKLQIEARRKAWERDPNFVPITLKPLKKKRKSIAPTAPAKLPVASPASEVRPMLLSLNYYFSILDVF